MRTNIGCAKFVKNPRTGEIVTTWAYYAGTIAVRGSGVLHGMPGDEIAGRYIADLVDSLGNHMHWDVVVKDQGNNIALVEWSDKDGNVTHNGVGIIQGDTMNVGWQEV